jgi:hypothetical protein
MNTLLELLDSRGEGRDMVIARLLDSADRLSNPQHRGNQFPWPDNAQMLRDLARSLATAPDPQPPAAPETDVGALREALAAATPGPWEVPDSIHGDPYITERGRGFLRGGGIATCDRRDDYGRSNARLIVTAVNALPALLADLDAARERVREVESERDAARTMREDWLADRDAALLARAESAEAAHEALRAGVEALADRWASKPDDRYYDGDRARSLRALLAGDAR